MMKETTKKQISIGYSVALIILAAALAVISVLPAFVIDTNDFEYPEFYYSGRYTSKMSAPNDIGIGLGTVVDIAMNFGDMITVINIQSLDADIEAQQEYIDRISKENIYSSETINKEKQDLAEMIADRDQALSKLTEEDVKRIEDKLQDDEGFIDVIGAVYCIIGTTTNGATDAIENSSKLGITTLDITIMVVSILFLIILIGTALVFPIVIIIKFLVLLIKSLKHIKEDSIEAIDKRMDKFPFTAYTGMMLMLYMLYALTSTGISMGAAIIGAMILLVVVCLLRAAKTILFAEKDRTLIIIKQAITLVSIVAVMLLLFNFVGIDLINELDSAVVDMSQKQYQAEIDKLANSGMEDHAIINAAQETVSSSNGLNTGIVVTLSLLGALLIVVAAINAIERFGNKMMKLKTGELVPYKAMVVLSVFLLIIAIIPSVFAVNSKEALDEAYEKGQFKIWYSEYKEDGTRANAEYEILKDLKEEGDTELAELREELASADGEKAEELKESIEDAEYMLTSVENQIEKIEAKTSRPMMCIIMAVLFLIAEYAYRFIPKILSKGKKDDEPTAAAEAEPVAE